MPEFLETLKIYASKFTEHIQHFNFSPQEKIPLPGKSPIQADISPDHIELKFQEESGPPVKGKLQSLNADQFGQIDHSARYIQKQTKNLLRDAIAVTSPGQGSLCIEVTEIPNQRERMIAFIYFAKNDSRTVKSIEIRAFNNQARELVPQFRNVLARVGTTLGQSWERDIIPVEWDNIHISHQTSIQEAQQKALVKPLEDRIRQTSSERIYKIYEDLLQKDGRFTNFALDSQLFARPNELAALSRTNTLKYLSLLQERHPDLTTAHNEIMIYTEQFLAQAAIAHNKTSHRETIVRISDTQQTEELGIKLDNPYLSATIIDPESISGKRDGSGWSPDSSICYLFSLEKYAPQALVAFGDIHAIGSPIDHGGPWREHVMTVPDATLIQAIHTWILEKNPDAPYQHRPYDEVMLFGTHNIETDSFSHFTPTASVNQRE